MKKMKKCVLVSLLICTMLMLIGCNIVSGDVLFLKGVEEYNNGDYISAIEMFEKASEIGVERYEKSELYNYLGGCYLDMDMYDNAIECYEVSIGENPDNVEYIVNLAVTYRKDGENKKAMELYQQALKIDPDYAELNSSIGSLYILENEPEKAVAYFDKAIELDPSLAIPYGNGALAYALIGDFETAEEYLEKAIMRGYENADVVRERIDALR